MSTPDRTSRSVLATVLRVGTTLVAVTLIAVALGLGAMVATGHRPIIITTGSMRPTAPPGTLIIAGPVSGLDIVADDVVVMRRPGATPVTHRVVEIVDNDGVRAAITQGDANDFLDPAPYVLGETDELVARWYLPGLGGVVEWFGSGAGATALVAVVLVIVTSIALRRIWSGSDDDDSSGNAESDGGRRSDGRSPEREADWAEERPWSSPATPRPAPTPVRAGGVL